MKTEALTGPADKLTDFAITKLNSLFDTISHTLPTVSKYVLQVTSTGCLFNLITGFLLLLVLIPVAYGFYRSVKYCLINEFDALPLPLLGIGIPMAVLLITTASYLLDFWQYVCVFHPDLYLVHQAILKVTG